MLRKLLIGAFFMSTLSNVAIALALLGYAARPWPVPVNGHVTVNELLPLQVQIVSPVEISDKTEARVRVIGDVRLEDGARVNISNYSVPIHGTVDIGSMPRHDVDVKTVPARPF